MPRILDETDHLVNPVRERYVPIAAPINTKLLSIARNNIRPPAVSPAASAGARESRQELRESIGCVGAAAPRPGPGAYDS